MTLKERELLLQDLSARLPYGVICLVEFSDDRKYAAKLTSVSVTSLGFGSSGVAYLHCCKPYLRPLSSMTEEERKEYKSFFRIGEYACGGSLYGEEYEYIDADSDDISQPISLIDWLIAHHFDFRGFIEKGLALEAPENMYKI